ncbi:MAG: hypothetical protein EZS28_032775 [Streblomastix strix]|uniref:Uncharacterized protein n=1 Tax=Streblomastix strix TaxID=222440 RepID=A0A5J4UMQ9_9EUKA|nr:MAG: hypothetical protein EZS28_032775 [Streblomastix strix]
MAARKNKRAKTIDLSPSDTKLQNNQLELEINNKVYKQFIEQIGNGTSQAQKELLSVIGLIAERGALNRMRYVDNQFYDLFKKSGMYKALDDIYIQEMQHQNQKFDKKITFSDFITQLIFTFTFINRNKRVETKRLKQAWNLFKHLIYKLERKLEPQDWMGSFGDDSLKLKRILKKIDGRMIEVKRVFQAMQGLIDCQENLNNFIKKFKCQFCLIHMIDLCGYPDTLAALELKSATFEAFAVSYLMIIASSSYLLSNLIGNNEEINKRSGSTVGFMEAVAELSLERNHAVDQNQQRKQLQSEIRYYNQGNFNYVMKYGNSLELKIIVKKLKFVQSEIELIAADQENDELKSKFLLQVFNNIGNIVKDLRYGTQFCHSKPALLKLIDEQIEEVGGLEEIDSNVKRINYGIKQQALSVLKQVNNPIDINNVEHIRKELPEVEQDNDEEDEQQVEVVRKYNVVFEQLENNSNNNEQEDEDDDEETNEDDVDYDEDSSSSQRKGRRHSYAFDDGDDDGDEEKCNVQ